MRTALCIANRVLMAVFGRILDLCYPAMRSASSSAHIIFDRINPTAAMPVRIRMTSIAKVEHIVVCITVWRSRRVRRGISASMVAVALPGMLAVLGIVVVAGIAGR